MPGVRRRWTGCARRRDPRQRGAVAGLEVAGPGYRLRLLNASNARALPAALEPRRRAARRSSRSAATAACSRAPARDAVDLVPVSATTSSWISARTSRRRGHPDQRFGEGTHRRVMRFVVGRGRPDDTRIPSALSTVGRLDPADAVRPRSFASTAHRERQQAYRINGEPFSTDRIWADVKQGDARSGSSPSGTTPCTFIVAVPGVPARRQCQPGTAGHRLEGHRRLSARGDLSRWCGSATMPGRFVFHCHNLEHEDMAMMANFRVS